MALAVLPFAVLTPAALICLLLLVIPAVPLVRQRRFSRELRRRRRWQAGEIRMGTTGSGRSFRSSGTWSFGPETLRVLSAAGTPLQRGRYDGGVWVSLDHDHQWFVVFAHRPVVVLVSAHLLPPGSRPRSRRE